MKKVVQKIPEGMNHIIPHLTVGNGGKALEFYKKALGAMELSRSSMPDGRVMHAMLKIGDSVVFLNDEFPEMGGCKGPQAGHSAVTLNLYVEDTDAIFQQAVAAGATVKMPPMDMFWGDRYAKITDPFGHEWAFATHIEDVTPEQVQQRAKEACAQMGKKA